MINFLFDTDVIIDFLRGNRFAIDFLSSNRKNQYLLSALTVTELFTGVRNESEVKAIQNVMTMHKIIEVDIEIAKQDGLFRKQYLKSHNIGFIDSIIASTAIYTNATLVT